MLKRRAGNPDQGGFARGVRAGNLSWLVARELEREEREEGEVDRRTRAPWTLGVGVGDRVANAVSQQQQAEQHLRDLSVTQPSPSWNRTAFVLPLWG